MRTNAGHRQRVKDRFRKEGLDNFEESHALELMLFYAIPRRDTKPIARRLLDQFGSLAAVLEADADALQQVDGVGPNTATYIKLLNETGRYYMVNRNRDEKVLSDLNKCGEFLVNFFYGRRNESVWLLCLDAKCKLLSCQQISEGSVNSASVSARRIMEIALSANAASVILAHNHPGGAATPSAQDVTLTKRIGAAVATMGLILADHIIVAEGDFVSMRQSGYYDPDACHYLF